MLSKVGVATRAFVVVLLALAKCYELLLTVNRDSSTGTRRRPPPETARSTLCCHPPPAHPRASRLSDLIVRGDRLLELEKVSGDTTRIFH